MRILITASKRKQILIAIISLIVVIGAVLVAVYINSEQTKQIQEVKSDETLDDGYFQSKYHSLDEADACHKEFSEHGRTENRLIGGPCPGDAQ
ncbi:MAG: hypothetical protein Q7T74_07475 [Candidatus Saccharibacteria bacterium]|nr:hypothetical protein [Candidatus Saccharibacteria bacterium]